jgi:hypothetical protein
MEPSSFRKVNDIDPVVRTPATDILGAGGNRIVARTHWDRG